MGHLLTLVSVQVMDHRVRLMPSMIPIRQAVGKVAGPPWVPASVGAFSIGPTNTTVVPNTLTWKDFIPGWMNPSANPAFP